jgi:hypothetical protein
MASDAVERAVRDLISRWSAAVDRSNVTVGLSFFPLAGVIFYVLCWPIDLSWWASALWGVGGSFLLVGLGGVTWESQVTAQAVRDFDRQFPPGHPERERAWQMLPPKLAVALPPAAPVGTTAPRPLFDPTPLAAPPPKRRTDERQE